MSDLSLYSLILGIVMGSLYALMVFAPAKAMAGFERFPRAKLVGFLFTAVALFGACWHLYHMSLGKFNAYKEMLYVLGPVVYIMIIVCMDELLAARSLGALMLLIPAPLLDAARVNDSPLRLVVVVIAYIMAVKGIFIVFSPYLFRQWVSRFIPSEKICRIYGMIGGAVALLLIVLALTVY